MSEEFGTADVCWAVNPAYSQLKCDRPQDHPGHHSGRVVLFPGQSKQATRHWWER